MNQPIWRETGGASGRQYNKPFAVWSRRLRMTWFDQTFAAGCRLRRQRTRAGRAIAVAALLSTAFLLPAHSLAAGPVEFGQAELQKVIEERGLNARSFHVAVEYSLVLPADGFQIQGQIIRGGARRGLMYGLLEAADQLRERKTLTAVKATPRFEIRAARLRASDDVLARPEREWRGLFETLARARFSRLRLEMRELTAERSLRLAKIAPLAEEHAIDLALSLEEIDPPLLLKLLGESIVFKAVQVPPGAAATALTTLSEAGRFVTLDIAANALTAELRSAAQELRVPLLGINPSALGTAPYLWLTGLAAPESLETLEANRAAGFEVGPLSENWTGLGRQLSGWSSLAFNEERGRAATSSQSASKKKTAKKHASQ